MQKKFRILRTLSVWAIISLLLQLSVYAAINHRIANVSDDAAAIITTNLEATLPDAHPENVQISYAKDYLAYMVNGTFKVFNLKQNKVVFTKSPSSSNDKNMGVLNYQWLPDRNILIYFYAKKNPNPYTMVTVPVTDKSEDTNKQNQEEKGTVTPTKIEKRVNNPQLTELNTLELPDSDDSSAQPDDRNNITLDTFPAGGKILQIVSSTYTNLMYVTIKTANDVQLMEIDVMKDSRMLNKAGETISNIAASDRHGTLYIESKTNGSKQIFAVSGWNRSTVSKNTNCIILGDKAGKVYLGEVKNGYLTNIQTGNDSSDISKTVQLSSIWQGSLPLTTEHYLVGDTGEVIIYNNEKASIIANGKVKEVNLSADACYISTDGAELIQLFNDGSQTKVKVQPLQD